MAVIRKPADMELGVYLARAKQHFAGRLLSVKHIVLFSGRSQPLIHTPNGLDNCDLWHFGSTGSRSDALRFAAADKRSTTIGLRYPNYCSLERYRADDDDMALMLIPEDNLFRISLLRFDDDFYVGDLLDE